MPRRKKPQPEMPDRELFESLFPQRVRKKVEQEVELEVPENGEKSNEERPIDREDT